MSSRVFKERTRAHRHLGRWLPAAVAVISLLCLWQAYAQLSGISPTTLPSPLRVLTQAWQNRLSLLENLLPTLRATLAGFACSLVAAFALSIAVDFSQTLRRALFPFSNDFTLIPIFLLLLLFSPLTTQS